MTDVIISLDAKNYTCQGPSLYNERDLRRITDGGAEAIPNGATHVGKIDGLNWQGFRRRFRRNNHHAVWCTLPIPAIFDVSMAFVMV